MKGLATTHADLRDINRTNPTKKEVELLQLMGQGILIKEAGEMLGLGRYTLQHRITRLRRVSKLDTWPQLVYWGLTNMYIHYPKGRLPKPKPHHVEVVEAIARTASMHQIASELHITIDGVEARIRNARKPVGARNQAHLVAIYWSQDWIA